MRDYDVVPSPAVPDGIHGNGNAQETNPPGYFAARQHRFLHASFCRNGAFLFRVRRMWMRRARAYATRGVSFPFTSASIQTVDDGRSFDYRWFRVPPGVTRNRRKIRGFASTRGFRSNIHNEKTPVAFYAYKLQRIDSLARMRECRILLRSSM